MEESTLNVNINRLRKKLSELGLEDYLNHKKRNGVYGMKISEYICDKGAAIGIGFLQALRRAYSSCSWKSNCLS